MTDEKKPAPETRNGKTVAPPGEGDSVEDAAKEAVEEMEKRAGAGHAGTGDIG